MAEALRLRQEAATLLGHATWAHYAIEVKMAETRRPWRVHAVCA
jgi:Zn-dependent oligopeptidase